MKLFIFDMGQVVADNVAVESSIAQMLGMSKNDFFSCCKYDSSVRGKSNIVDIHSADILTMLSDGHITTADFWKEVYVRTGKRIDADYMHIFFNPVLNGDVVKIIKTLREKNYRVVCGTNTVESHYRVHLERGDYALFDKIYASNVLGVSKPDVVFWQRILLGEHTEAEHVFFVDDNEENCLAAKSLGIYTHQFVNAEILQKEIDVFLQK